ncbi:MAG TPA: molecular chaperone TorD family protein [Candidatus Methylomirabilis sp.]|nr:molecular chaperone TorD family protein [Candidatus Methylomirabilis sp.]
MTETAAITDPRIQELLGEATTWRLLGLLFERPREGWWQEVESLQPAARDADVAATVEAAREEATEGLYLAVLGPGGLASPREVAYRGMGDPGQILSDIRAFHQVFAFRPETEEPPDHVAVEAGFLGYLCLKQAYARARGNEDQAEIVAQAATLFCQEHLSALAWPLSDRLEKTEIKYLSLAARAIAHRTGPRPATHPAAENQLLACDSDCALDCGQA